MGLPLRSPVAKLSCEAATEENAKRQSFMPRTQVTGKANFSPGITSGLAVTRTQYAPREGVERPFSPSQAELSFRISANITAYLEPPGRGCSLVSTLTNLYPTHSKRFPTLVAQPFTITLPLVSKI